VKRKPIECKKIFGNYSSEKGLITRIDSELRKTKLPQNQKTQKGMRNFQRKKHNWPFNTLGNVQYLGHKGNRNKKVIEISHHCY
jgi:hypothetical protein